MRRLVIAGASLALLLAGCGGSSDNEGTTTQATDGCRTVSSPAPREDGGATPPSERLDPEKSYRLVFATSCGSFTVRLDQASAPATTASLVALARQGFFDDTVFHRIVPGFVIQGGDPTQAGDGGPGYSTVDPPPTGAAYVRGVVAMAKTPDEPTGTAGSQFFVVTAADANLDPEYAIVGKVTDGLAVVERIGELGDPATELPLQPVVVDTVSVADVP